MMAKTLTALLVLLAPQAAAARTVELGLGALKSFHALDNPGDPAGLRLSGRYPLGSTPVTFEGGLYVANPFAPEATGTVSTLVQIAHQGNPAAAFQQPFSVDGLGLHAVADLAPIPEGFGQQITCAPHLLGGLSVMRGQTYYASYNSGYSGGEDSMPYTLSEGQPYTQVRPMVAVGMDTWFHGRVGLRLLLQARPGFEDQPDYDPSSDTPTGRRFDTESTLAFDLLVGL